MEFPQAYFWDTVPNIQFMIIFSVLSPQLPDYKAKHGYIANIEKGELTAIISKNLLAWIHN